MKTVTHKVAELGELVTMMLQTFPEWYDWIVMPSSPKQKYVKIVNPIIGKSAVLDKLTSNLTCAALAWEYLKSRIENRKMREWVIERAREEQNAEKLKIA